MSDSIGDNLQRAVEDLRRNLNSVILGKAEVIDKVLVALFGGGNILLEDVPGVGKTTLAKSLARSLKAEYRRIQFTPDLLPADILGTSIFHPQTGEFSFRKGPVFAPSAPRAVSSSSVAVSGGGASSGGGAMSTRGAVSSGGAAVWDGAAASSGGAASSDCSVLCSSCIV